ncbi:MAG: porin [Gemmatimonadota bacterium]
MTGLKTVALVLTAGCFGSVLQCQTPPALPKLGGYLQARENYQTRRGLTASLNRARVSVDGTAGGGFSYRILVEYAVPPGGTAASVVSLRDAYIRWIRSAFTVTAGQFKVPFSREFLTSITVLESADRSAVVDAIAPKRDLGLMAEYNWRSAITISVGAFNGEGQNQPTNRDSVVMIAARVTMRPVAYLSLAGNVARSGSDSSRYGIDAQFDYHGATLKVEYLGEHRGMVSRDDHGWFALAGFRVTPRLQLILKNEDLERPSLALFQRNRAVTGGANLDLVPGKIRFIADYVSRKIGDPGQRTGTLITQLQVRF